VNRHHDIGESNAGDDVDFFFLNEFLSQLNAQVGFELIVFFEHLHRTVAQLAAQVIDGQHESVVLVLTQRTSRA